MRDHALHGLLGKAATTVVTGAVGAAAYDLARMYEVLAPRHRGRAHLGVCAAPVGPRLPLRTHGSRSPTSSPSQLPPARRSPRPGRPTPATPTNTEPVVAVTSPVVLSDAAGRLRPRDWLARHGHRRGGHRGVPVLRPAGARAVHAYPRSASVVVWYRTGQVTVPEVLAANATACDTPSDLLPARFRTRRRSQAATSGA